MYALTRPTAHAIPWRPLLAGATLGLAVLLLPTALSSRLTPTQLTTLARLAAVCAALGTAFLLDDPSARSTRVVPTPRLARNLLRLALATPTLTLWWALTLTLVHKTGHAAHLPIAALTLETATLLTAALALSALTQRRTPEATPSLTAAPAVLLLAAAAWSLPHPLELTPSPNDPTWPAAHHHWTALLAIALATFLWASTDQTSVVRWRS